MKCKYCHGTGKIDGSFYFCDKCNGTGEYEPFDTDIELDKLYSTKQTNEEWLNALSTTEEKAEAIYECVMENYWNFNKNRIKRWLKQPHTIKE